MKKDIMKVPFLDLKIQYESIKDEINPAIQKILDNTAFIMGKAVSDFEDDFAAAHNIKYCAAVSSGTDGNHLALWALGVGPGDEVIIPANTFIATAWGATLCGAIPVFVDCHPQSYNIDTAKVEAAITSKTKAIVAVHLYGQPAELDELKKIADRNKIYLVEDCAQAHLAEYKNKKVGGTGITSSFSFYPGKNLGAYGEGGAIMTNNEEIYHKVRMMREHGSVQKYNHEIYGHNYRMEGIQGAVLGVKLPHLNKWTEGRRKAAALYKQYLSDIEEIILPFEMENVKHVYHLFVIQIREGGLAERDALSAFLLNRGVSTGFHYPIPLHLQKCFNHLNYKKGDFPITEKLAESGLSLPMYPELREDQIKYVTDNIKDYFKLKSQVIAVIEEEVE